MAATRDPLTIRRIVGGKFGLFMIVVCGGLAALSFGVGYPNLLSAKRSAYWPSTSGEVVHAEVEEHVNVGKDRKSTTTITTNVTHESSIVYVYRVGGKEYRGDRVRFSWEMNRAEAEATVAKYPVGASVRVYYDPDDPSDAVLETGGDAYVYQVMIGLGVFFVALASVYFGIRTLVLVYLPGFHVTIDKNMAARVSNAKGWRAKWAACNWIQKTALVISIPMLSAILIVWMTVGFILFYDGVEGYRNPEGSQKWPETSGLVLTSEMKPVLVKETVESGPDRIYHRYDLTFVVEYRVLANRHVLEEHRSIFRDEETARETLARYPQGQYVSVYYDPGDPGSAQLTPHEPAGLVSAVLGALMMLPWLSAGVILLGVWLKKRYLTPPKPAGAA